VTLSSDLAAAPVLVQPLELAVTLVGIGAIGTGVVLKSEELTLRLRLSSEPLANTGWICSPDTPDAEPS
jgi:hypothetical protein